MSTASALIDRARPALRNEGPPEGPSAAADDPWQTLATPEHLRGAPTKAARLGRYQLLHALGAGGMGTVYLAEDPQLGRRVAIKVPTFTGSPEEQARERQRFEREARAAAAVRHRHVCAIYDVGDHEGKPFVVMDYIDGPSLADRLRRDGRFEDYKLAVALVGQIAEALAAVHEAGLIHRDLKPGNILLDRRGDAYLSDFGLARRQSGADQVTSNGALVGTPAYMAPEQISGDQFGPVSARSDVYSLGAVLYVLLTGHLPFRERDTIRLLYQIVHDPVPGPRSARPDLDPALEAIVLKAMARRPEDRYADAGAFGAALRQWQDGTASRRWQDRVLREPETRSRDVADVPGVSRRMAEPPGRRRGRLWPALAPAALVLVLAAAGAFYHRRSSAPAPYKGKLDLWLVERDARPCAPRAVGGPDTLPLRAGDGIVLDGRLDQGPPAHFYVVWIDSDGKATLLHPEGWERERLPAADDKHTALRWPKEGRPPPLSESAGGLEAVLWLVRDRPLDPRANDELQQLLGALTWRQRPEWTGEEIAVWWEDGRRDVKRGAPARRADEDDPLSRTEKLLLTLKERGLARYSLAVCYSFAGRGNGAAPQRGDR